MKIGLVLKELHRSENDLAHPLLVVSARHKADHEIFHGARDLAVWAQTHVREIARTGRRSGSCTPALSSESDRRGRRRQTVPPEDWR